MFVLIRILNFKFCVDWNNYDFNRDCSGFICIFCLNGIDTGFIDSEWISFYYLKRSFIP